MAKLSLFYRKFLRGEDLAGKACQVEIIAAKPVQVRPNPRSEEVTKLCLWVKGLPADLPNGILVGPKMVDQLVSILGDIDTAQLAGRLLVIYPQKMRVAGVEKTAIRFRKAANGSQASSMQASQDASIAR